MTVAPPPLDRPPQRTTPDASAPPVRGIARMLGSSAAALVVFAVTALQALVDPIVIAIDGGVAWDQPVPLAAVVVLVILACATQAAFLRVSGRHPVIAVFGVLGSYLAVTFLLSIPAWTGAMQLVVAVALLGMATRKPPATSVAVLAVVAAVGLATIAGWVTVNEAPPGLVLGFMLEHGLALLAPAAGATALGALWAAHSRRTADARERAARLEREHEAQLTETRDRERARIAQELHDVAGQHIAGLISLCDASVDLAQDDPERALRLVEEVRAEGRFAAASLYGALGDLRSVDTRSTPATPDLRSVEDLFSFWRRRGMAMRTDAASDLDDLPAVVSTTAYRALQEGLANAAKHARGAVVTVAVQVERDRVAASVVNGPARAAHGVAESRIGLGWGLEGLRDRLLLVDGVLETGPTDDGGWRLRADIPMPDLSREDASA